LPGKDWETLGTLNGTLLGSLSEKRGGKIWEGNWSPEAFKGIIPKVKGMGN